MLRSSTLLLFLLFCIAEGRAQPALADRIQDLRTETAVRLALAEDAGMDGVAVAVEAADGVVLLSGLVPTLGARDRVVSITNGLSGVREVRSTIRLEGRPTEALDDGAGGNPADISDNDGARQAVPEPASQPPPVAGPVFHTVAPGDTLFNIARHYETTVVALSQLNSLGSTTVRVGQRLRVK